MTKPSTSEPGDPGARRLRIAGLVEPWAPGLEDDVRVFLGADCASGVAGATVRPDSSGGFMLEADLTPEWAKLLKDGHLEVRAETSDGKALGATPLRAVAKAGDLGVKIRIRLPERYASATTTRFEAGGFVSPAAVQRMARGLARLQGVAMREARMPAPVRSAIDELNRVDEIASRTLAGDLTAAKALGDMLAAAAFAHPGGAGSGAPGLAGGGGIGGIDLHDAVSGAVIGGGCGPALGRAVRVMDAAFRLDWRARHADARWTRQARAFVQTRMRTVGFFAGSVERGMRDSFGGGWGRPPDEGYVPFPDGPGDPFPPGGFPPEPEPPAPPGGDWCDQVHDLCLALYEEVQSALLRDTLTDLIATVEPGCLCSGYDPNQVFIARPQPGRVFPVANTPAGPALPADVLLYFGSLVLTPLVVQPDEIRFRIPANAHTGFVYLRALGSLPSQASRELGRACGLAMPELPAGLLVDRAPAALISIVYPPVIDRFTSSAAGQPAEACTPVDIAWRVRLADQAPELPLPPCAAIEVIVRDADGTAVATGGAAGSVIEARGSDASYMIEARSMAGGALCGVANPATLTVQRVHRLRLAADPATGVQVLAGAPGRFGVSLSCPALGGGTAVDLVSSDAAALQVPAQVVVPEGEREVAVDFTTAAACAPVDISAAAANHALVAPLRIDVFSMPALQWATGAAPGLIEGAPFAAEVDASCVPDEDERARWVIQPANPASGRAPVAATATRVGGQYPASRIRVTAAGLAAVEWELVVELPDRGNVRSNALAFAVALRPSFEIASVTPTQHAIEWDSQAVYDIVIEGRNNADVTIDLSAAFARGAALSTAGLQEHFNPPDVVLSPANPTAASALTLSAPLAVAALGSRSFQIQAQPRSAGYTTRRVNASVNVRRSLGLFTPKHVASSDPPCGAVSAMVKATGDGPGVEFTIATPSGPAHTSPRVVPAVYYAISPRCRIGVIVAPRQSGVNGADALSFYNLGFAPTTGAPQLGAIVRNIPSIFWQQFWFSPDDSLLMLIGRAAGGTPNTHTASLLNMIDGAQFGATEFFTPAIIQSADDPSPLQPGDTEIRLAVIEQVELTRDAMGRDVATVSYRDLMNQVRTFSKIAQ
jgi:hypothetical protein